MAGTIHEFDLAGALDGSEELEIQLIGGEGSGGASLRTTAQAIANLAARLVRPTYLPPGDALLASGTAYIKQLPNTGDPAETWTLPQFPANGSQVSIRTFVSVGGDGAGAVTLHGNDLDIVDFNGVSAPTMDVTGFSDAYVVYETAQLAWLFIFVLPP